MQWVRAKNSTLYRTINDAYSNYKEDTRYPIVTILIECDPSLLDVNIHPSKMDIKFSNFEDLNNLIKSTIIGSIKDKLLIPKLLKGNNPDYWVKKIQNNIDRDIEIDKKLLFLGWNVLHFWGKEILRNTDDCVKVIEELIFEIRIDDDCKMQNVCALEED